MSFECCFFFKKKLFFYWTLFAVTVAVDSLTGVVATTAVGDAAAFFGRPRFLAAPSLLVATFGFGSGFATPADPDGRPRFLVDGASWGAGGVTGTTAFFGVALDGRPRVFFVDSSTISCFWGLTTGAGWTL